MQNKKSFFMGLAAGAVLMLVVVMTASISTTRARWGEHARPDMKITEILMLLERHSIIPFDTADLLTGMYRGLLGAVDDPYTQYFDAVALEAFRIRTDGVFGGIGVDSFMDNGVLTIANVFPGAPAEAAGLLPGDRIVAVDGVEVVDMEQSDINTRIRGPEGTTVRLAIERDGARFIVDVTRATIILPTVSHEMVEDDTGLIRISGFDRMTPGQFYTALTALTAQGMTALVIDVRNNPGGLMPAVVNITNHLVPEGIITYTELADGRREYYRATAGQLGLPLAILVNGGSASASEILAGAVQDTGAGIIVGTQTFGKGIVQNLMHLSDGNAIKTTTARYFTPNGTSIHGVGVTPCLVVPMAEELAVRAAALPFEEDVQLQAAVAQLRRVR